MENHVSLTLAQLRLAVRPAAAVLAAVASILLLAQAGRASGSEPSRAAGTGSGGAPIGGLVPKRKRRRKVPPPPSKNAHGSWIAGVTITEYWPAPESWFIGKLVTAPGLPGKHRVDWLYSATGVSMQGDGIGLDGRRYHIDSLGRGGWVTSRGAATSPADGWAAGPPFWRAGGYWQNSAGAVTFPLLRGGWYRGRGRHYKPLPGVTFAKGASLPLQYYRSLAVDPGVIPLGSRIYIPAYRHDGYGGWFIARDTGGAVNGHHVDVYRTPPSSPRDGGNYLTGQRIYVIKPGR